MPPGNTARGLKFWVYEAEGFYYLCSENKNADQLHSYGIVDLRLCFHVSKKQAFSWRAQMFLAHLSQRLIGELIGYRWSGVRPSVRPSSVVRRRPFTMLKDLLLQNCLANQSQILCGASLGRGNESLFAASGSHDQDGRHAHIW